jgi:hypothetical protein
VVNWKRLPGCVAVANLAMNRPALVSVPASSKQSTRVWTRHGLNRQILTSFFQSTGDTRIARRNALRCYGYRHFDITFSGERIRRACSGTSGRAPSSGEFGKTGIRGNIIAGVLSAEPRFGKRLI